MFSDYSFGYRSNKNCHDALYQIKYKWQNTTWLIRLDIQKFCDTINHEILIKELHKYCDQASVELIVKLLKCGYIDLLPNWSEDKLSKETRQGSLISPVLSNLYLTALDLFVENHLIRHWNFGDEKKFVKRYQSKKYLTAKDKILIAEYPELRESIAKVKHNRWVFSNKPARDLNDEAFRRLYYIRYTGDVLIGFCGTKAEAQDIKQKLIEFLEEKLKLGINLEKSKLQHSSDKNFLFLGYFIRYQPNKLVSDLTKSIDDEVIQLKSVAINNASIKAPVCYLLEKAVERKCAVKKTNGNFRATSQRELASLAEKQIVDRFSSIIRGILQYYSCVNQRSDLWSIVALYRKSCALTLADKLRLRTAAQAFKKFGPLLSIKDGFGKEITKLYYPVSLKTKIDFKRSRSNINQYACIYADEIFGSYKTLIPKPSCEFDGCNETTGLQVHHSNPQKNIDKRLTAFEKSLAASSRKTVTLCQLHYKILHGKKLV